MTTSALRLAENLALIREKCDKPIPPTKNALPDGQDDGKDGGKRALKFQDELEIVNCLSYLATYSDHPGQVLALCVEESADSCGLTVSIATNNDDASYLEGGVRSIAEALERQAHDRNGDYLMRLLDLVLRYAPDRLAERFGYPDSTTARRLDLAIQYALRTANMPGKMLDELRMLSKDFARLAASLKKPLLSNQAPSSEVFEVLTVATRIWANHRISLEQIMADMPSIGLCPSAKDIFLHRIRQLAQYKLASTKLLQYARRFCLFKSIRVQTIHTGPTNLQPLLSDPPVPDTGLLNRYLQGHETTRSNRITSAMQALGKRKSASLQSELRRRIVCNTASHKYKAHAEIQLLFHYETHKAAYPPRVLKSNKDACYACHLFIQTHGQWYTPKTHGRVYELWMLPDVNGVKGGMDKEAHDKWASIVGRFNEEVEKVVLQAAQGKGHRGSGDPRESAIFSVASTNTTIQASVVSRSGSDRTIPASVVSGSDSGRTVTGPVTRSRSSDTIRSAKVWSEPESAGDEESAPQDELVSPITPTSPYQFQFEEKEDRDRSKSSIEMTPEQEPTCHERQAFPPQDLHAFPILNLEPGLAQVYTFDNNHKAVHVHTRKIRLELTRSEAEFMAARPASKRHLAELHIHIAWLDYQRANRIVGEDMGAIVDLRAHWTTLKPEEGVLLSTSGLLLRNGNDVLQIKARAG